MVEGDLKNYLSQNRPMFGTRCSLTFDITIATYTITSLLFYFYLLYSILRYRFILEQKQQWSLVPFLLCTLTDSMMFYGREYKLLGAVFLLQGGHASAHGRILYGREYGT